MNDLNKASSESEELIARGKDDGDDIIILVLYVRDRQKRILQLASFLNKSFQYSGKDYFDSEYSWKYFLFYDIVSIRFVVSARVS